ncbi:MAG: T9SS type A sorting domain-containing protein [Calditrichales bacterium]|nr:MAG: T9SS type A sorting domain-containing protein [Calditrichales bacterium]
MRFMQNAVLLILIVVCATGITFAQSKTELDVPWVDTGVITLDGVMDEAEWESAASADLVTAETFNIWVNPYGRAMAEPEYDEFYARVLWTMDTLYVFVHIDEYVNDSTDLFWAGQWTGDQLFLGLSSRLGEDMLGWYDGNFYRSPEGPYHFWILEDQVTLNMDGDLYVPDQFSVNEADTVRPFYASDIARWATKIDTNTGLWNVEMAIYHPHANALSTLGFNIGGSIGSQAFYDWSLVEWEYGDAYAYFCWQPSVADDPFAEPEVSTDGDPGSDILKSANNWALLNLLPNPGEVEVRRVLEVPRTEPGDITIDGNMDEVAWETAASANLVTDTEFNIWINPYGRESMAEPEYDEFYGRVLWTPDTLYAFIHIDEYVNDSTDLFWAGQWTGDQLFVGMSGRLGEDMLGWYDGNFYRTPEGPYHFWILEDQVTLNMDGELYVPDQFSVNEADTVRQFYASDIARWATKIDTNTGLWNVEMAIYNPAINEKAKVGFNIGGSIGSQAFYDWSLVEWEYGDAYAYFCWQPSVPDDFLAEPDSNTNGDPGSDILMSSKYWAVLDFSSTTVSGLRGEATDGKTPEKFTLGQNYPNPFNPSTTIRFSLEKKSPVTLRVFNTLGQTVATLIDNKPYASGSYDVTWTIKDLASGVYFYELSTAGFSQTKKMVFMK